MKTCFAFIKENRLHLSVEVGLTDFVLFILFIFAIVFCLLAASFYHSYKRWHTDCSFKKWIFETDNGKVFLISCTKIFFPFWIVFTILILPLMLAGSWAYERIRKNNE